MSVVYIHIIESYHTFQISLFHPQNLLKNQPFYLTIHMHHMFYLHLPIFLHLIKVMDYICNKRYNRPLSHQKRKDINIIGPTLDMLITIVSSVSNVYILLLTYIEVFCDSSVSNKTKFPGNFSL